MIADETLRLRALDALGPLGDALAREALEAGTVRVEHAVAIWEASHGTVQAHRVVLEVPAELHARAAASPAAEDALSAAFAAALADADVSGKTSLYDFRLCEGAGERRAPTGSPYRTPR